MAETTAARPAPPVTVVGVHGGAWFGAEAEVALRAADVLVGAARIHRALPPDLPGERVELFGPLDQVIDLIEQRRANGQRVCMLASGDPGFFGIERLLVGRFGDAVVVHPAPSSVALAFARARINWDDAAVVSCHGRSLDRALPPIVAAPKVAVLVSASTPPEAVGSALLAAGSTHRRAVVCSRLGEVDECIVDTDLHGLANGTFDPLSVVVLDSVAPPIGGTNAVVAWGRPEASFAHRAGMITKPEVRAAALSKLQLFPAATFWDIGAASGSVGIEAARLVPGLRVFAVEQNPEDCRRIEANAGRVALTVVEGRAPEVLADLPDPDRVFVGGGGLETVEAAVARLRPGGVIVGTFVVLETAIEAMAAIGPSAELVQIQVSRGVPIGADHRLRLEAENPAFIIAGTPT